MTTPQPQVQTSGVYGPFGAVAAQVVTTYFVPNGLLGGGLPFGLLNIPSGLPAPAAAPPAAVVPSPTPPSARRRRQRRAAPASPPASLLADSDEENDETEAHYTFHMVDDNTGEETPVQLTARAPTHDAAWQAMLLLLTRSNFEDESEDGDDDDGLTVTDLMATTTLDICSDNEDIAALCTVCQDDMVGPIVVRRTSCGHVFHATCLERAAITTTTCPLCRTSLRARDSGAGTAGGRLVSSAVGGAASMASSEHRDAAAMRATERTSPPSPPPSSVRPLSPSVFSRSSRRLRSRDNGGRGRR